MKWVRRLALLGLAIIVLVLAALGFAWWATTPPDGYAATPPDPPVVIAAPAGPIRVGAAAVAVTPGPGAGAFLGGFGLNRRWTGIHDPLFARAIAFERDGARVVLVVLDAIGVHHNHAARVRERLAARLRPEGVLVLATHDHSAPDLLGLWGPSPFRSGVDPAFLEAALAGCVEAASRALDALEPARLTLGHVAAPAQGISKNKRDPGLIDREVTVLAADRAANGEPIATLVIFACHPEVLSGDNTLVTADFPGPLLRTIEARRGGTGIFINGPLGGMVSPDVSAHTFEECERVGTTLAATALGALAAPDAAHVDSGALAWVQQPILVPIQNRRYIAGRKIGVLDRPFEGAGHVRSEVCGFVLGPLELATIPGEALPRVGLHVKESLRAPFRAVVCLAGDELGYIIPEDAFGDDRRYSYEKTVSPGPLATSLIRTGAREAAATAWRESGGGEGPRGP